MKLSALPVIPVNVVQSVIMLGHGLYLLRGLRKRAAEAVGQAPSAVMPMAG